MVQKIKLMHNGREINDDAVNYGNEAMIQYKDTGETAIVLKSEIITEVE